jgi:hypothetical protein
MLRARLAQEKAPPDRAAALREEFATKSSADAAAENARRRALQQTFGSERPRQQRGRGADPTATDEHTARLRAEFGQDRTAGREGDQARQEALRQAFAKGGERKTPEQIRQTLQERGKSAPQRSAGKSCDGSRGKGGGRDIER